MIAEPSVSEVFTSIFVACAPDDFPIRDFLLRRLQRDCSELQFLSEADREPFSPNWMLECRRSIGASDVLLCLIGESTWSLQRVLWIINTGYALKKKVLGVRMHRDRAHPLPKPLILNESPVVDWHSTSLLDHILPVLGR